VLSLAPPAPQDDRYDDDPADLVQHDQPKADPSSPRQHYRPSVRTRVAWRIMAAVLATAAAPIIRLEMARMNATVLMPRTCGTKMVNRQTII